MYNIFTVHESRNAKKLNFIFLLQTLNFTSRTHLTEDKEWLWSNSSWFSLQWIQNLNDKTSFNSMSCMFKLWKESMSHLKIKALEENTDWTWKYSAHTDVHWEVDNVIFFFFASCQLLTLASANKHGFAYAQWFLSWRFASSWPRTP